MSFIRKLTTAPLGPPDHNLMNEISNNTSEFAGIPPNILEIFLPNYGLITKTLSHVVGLDITYLASMGVLVFGTVVSIHYLTHRLTRGEQGRGLRAAAVGGGNHRGKACPAGTGSPP